MIKEFFLVLKGIGMGAANVIPGVSGGTIALVTGIFEELILGLKSFNFTALKLVFKGRFKEFADYVHLKFLVLVFLGVFISLFSIAKLFTYLFEHHPIHLWSFFFGLILTSIYYVGRTITRFSFWVWVWFAFGSIIAVLIAVLTPGKESDNIFYLFVCGIVAICGMILPGISGSFILILMGNYKLIMLEGVSNFDMSILIPVGIGTVVGLVGFSYVLSYIFKHFPNQTLGLLTGFIAGSLYTIWPWKEVITTFVDSEGEIHPLIQRNRLPWEYTEITGQPDHLWAALLWIFIGVILIVVLESMANMQSSSKK